MRGRLVGHRRRYYPRFAIHEKSLVETRMNYEIYLRPVFDPVVFGFDNLALVATFCFFGGVASACSSSGTSSLVAASALPLLFCSSSLGEVRLDDFGPLAVVGDFLKLDADAGTDLDLDLFFDIEEVPLGLDEVLRVTSEMGFRALETTAGEDGGLGVKDLLFVLAALLTWGECSFL